MTEHLRVQLNKQKRIYNLFDAITMIDNFQWSEEPGVCPYCCGFPETNISVADKWKQHRKWCPLMSLKGRLFKTAISVASEMRGGNKFINNVFQLYFNNAYNNSQDIEYSNLASAGYFQKMLGNTSHH